MLFSINKEELSEYFINELKFQRKQEILELFTNQSTMDVMSRT